MIKCCIEGQYEDTKEWYKLPMPTDIGTFLFHLNVSYAYRSKYNLSQRYKINEMIVSKKYMLEFVNWYKNIEQVHIMFETEKYYTLTIGQINEEELFKLFEQYQTTKRFGELDEKEIK